MKKRTVSIIVVMILLVSMLSGCGLITLNAERDGAQVVATVNVQADDANVLQGVVSKVDVVNAFNQVGYMYIQYYGWSVDKIVNELVSQLSNKEILSLVAMKEIAVDKGIAIEDIAKANNAYVANMGKVGTNKYDATMRPYDLFNMFGADEQLYVIKETKKSLKSSYDTIVAEVEAELAANAPEKEDDKKPESEDEDKKEDEEELKPRTTKTPITPAGFVADSSITADAVEAEKTFFEEMDEELKANKLTKAEAEAYDRLKKNIIKSYDTIEIAWNTLLDAQKESRLLVKYQDDYINKGVEASVDEILSRYNHTITLNNLTVFDKDSYKTAIEADKNNDLLVHSDKDGVSYFTVKSILLQFNADQKKALEAIKAGAIGGTDDLDAIYTARESLALSDGFEIPGVTEKGVGGIKVNVSNPNYDPNAKCKDENCECVACTNSKNFKKGAKCEDKDCKCVKCVNRAYDRRDVDFTTILNEMSIALKNAEKVVMPEGATDIEKQAIIANAKMDVFDDYIYLVNDDPGMFNSTGYMVNTKGDSSYVGEYVTLARELAKANKVGAVGTVAPANYPNATAKKPAEVPEIAIHQYTAPEGKGDAINYIVNDFGIHIIMVTYLPNKTAGNTTVIDAEKGLYQLNGDFTVKYENAYKRDDEGKLVLDENGNKIVTELKNLTVNAKLAETIKGEKKSANYSKKEKEILDANKDNVKRDEGIIKSIIGDIEKQVGKLPAHNHDGHNH